MFPKQDEAAGNAVAADDKPTVNTTGSKNNHGHASADGNGVGGKPGTVKGHHEIVPVKDSDGDGDGAGD